MNRKFNKKRGKRVPRNQKRALRNANHPPMLMTSVRVDHVIRYQTAAAVQTTVTVQNLADTWLIAATATTGFQLANAVKLRKVEAWATPPSSLVPVTVDVNWVGPTAGSFGPESRVSDTSVGSNSVAHIVARPPALSQVSQWQSAASTNQLFIFTAPVACVVDVHISFMVRDSGTALAVQNALVGATVGANYFRGLDGAGAAGTSYIVQSYAQA